MAVFVVEFPGFLVLMVAWGLKIVWKKFHEKFTQNNFFFSQNPKIIFYYIFACVRAEEEKLKLMLQLDEVQLRLKSAEFRKPVTKMIILSFSYFECYSSAIIINVFIL